VSPAPPAALRIDIGEMLEGHAAWIGATLHTPATPQPVAALFCFPGGGMTQSYFNLEGASFAQAMVSCGFVVVTFDHYGTGDSAPARDAFTLTGAVLARADAQATLILAKRLRAGEALPGLPPMPDLVIIGVGHSMGGMIVTMQQSYAQPYAGLALLGFSTRGLPEVLNGEEKLVAAQKSRGAEDYVRLAQARFGAPLADIPVRGNGSAALLAASGPLLAVSAMQSMLPGNIADEAAAIDVPVFLAVGDRDITGRPGRIAAAFGNARAVELLVSPATGHHPFIAPSAPGLYSALSAWAGRVATAA
jgi:pimeloyl-ACP methyl ester carboxylesterase